MVSIAQSDGYQLPNPKLLELKYSGLWFLINQFLHKAKDRRNNIFKNETDRTVWSYRTRISPNRWSICLIVKRYPNSNSSIPSCSRWHGECFGTHWAATKWPTCHHPPPAVVGGLSNFRWSEKSQIAGQYPYLQNQKVAKIGSIEDKPVRVLAGISRPWYSGYGKTSLVGWDEKVKENRLGSVSWPELDRRLHSDWLGFCREGGETERKRVRVWGGKTGFLGFKTMFFFF